MLGVVAGRAGSSVCLLGEVLRGGRSRKGVF